MNKCKPLKPGEVAPEEEVEMVTVPSLVLVATQAIEAGAYTRPLLSAT